jgi:carboxyl-terminal processing protease
MPLVFLVDKETSTGAEMLASAIRDYQIAPIVGAQTSGNASISRPRPLPDGSVVQITVGRLVAPSGNAIDKVGVEPDLEIDLAATDLERGEDPQLSAGIEIALRLMGGANRRLQASP